MTFSTARNNPNPEAADPGSRGVTLRALLIAIILTIGCGFWVRQAEIVVLATQITESVPPVPAIAVLICLVALHPLLRLIARRWTLHRAEILAIYCFVTIAISLPGCGIIRFWLNLVSTPFYFATPENGFATLYRWMPGWLYLKNLHLIKELYEGSPTGRVPWGAWALPLFSWTVFFLALWFCMLCLVRLVAERWIQEERLTFPIVKLPLEVTADQGRHPSFLHDPVMWAGFALAAAYNGLNILNAFFPALPCPGKSLDLDPILASTPWDSLRPITLWYRPDLIGFGFLVPTEILFSIWFFALFGRVESLLAHLLAWDFPGAPFEQEQSMGAYLLLGASLLFFAARDLWKRRSGQSAGRPGEPPLWTVAGAALSLAFLCWFLKMAGMAVWVSAAYLGIVLVAALVSARIRAEAGIPLIWLFPFYQQKKILLYALGSSAFLTGGVPATLTIFATLTFLSRGYFPALIGYQVESLKIADESRISRGRMVGLMMAAALVGLLIAYYIHLQTYYQYGAQHLGGIWGFDMPSQEYSHALSSMQTPQRPDLARTTASAAGALFTLILVLLRRSFVGFPLHPLGYAVATAYGSLVWWSFLLVWIIKSLILKWGGMRLYRRAVPFFLGFALGHFFAAGVVWGLLGAFWRDAAHAYAVWFG